MTDTKQQVETSHRQRYGGQDKRTIRVITCMNLVVVLSVYRGFITMQRQIRI